LTSNYRRDPSTIRLAVETQNLAVAIENPGYRKLGLTSNLVADRQVHRVTNP